MSELNAAVFPLDRSTPLRPAQVSFGSARHLRRRLVAAALILGDLATVAIVAGLVWVFNEVTGTVPKDPAAAALTIGAPVFILALHALGLYGRCGSEPIERFRLRVVATLFAAAFLGVWSGWSGRWDDLWPDILLGGLLAIVLGHYVENGARHVLIRHRLWGAATVVFGERRAAAALAASLAAQPDLGLRPIAIVDDTLATDSFDHTLQLPLLAAHASIATWSGGVEVAVCADGDLAPGRAAWLASLPFHQLLVAHQAPALETLRLRTRCLGPVVGLEMRRAIFLPHNLRLKRLLDLAIGLPAALLALPVVAVLAAAIKVVDPGPAFYVQPRVGRNGRVIHVLKLRSMYADAEPRLIAHLAENAEARAEWERFCKLSRDPRVLPLVGGFIRRTSLDELPQLWNVVRGDMSVVGPRPFPSYHTERFDPDFQMLRASVPPGLTGLWQVSSRSDGDLSVQKQQDTFYIQNWSIWVDLYVLLQTVPAVLAAKGAR